MQPAYGLPKQLKCQQHNSCCFFIIHQQMQIEIKFPGNLLPTKVELDENKLTITTVQL